ncbi:MAG: hypothetical protein DMF66_04350 [Acidobacteria bacterium]|nr:MAG: hypothetical protein DMF66_04350 [Acidobacteriota bacterium]
MIEERHREWVQELENKEQTAYIEVVSGLNFTAAFPPGMSTQDFVDKLAAALGRTLSQQERTAMIAALGSGDVAGRAAALRMMDAKI